MAIGVDTSKWKTRKIQGTPANKVRNLLGAGILTFGIISGLIFHFSSVTEGLRKQIDKFYEDPVEEVERKMMIAAGMPNRTGDALRKYKEDFEKPNQPFK